jgi:hypothetical protein
VVEFNKSSLGRLSEIIQLKNQFLKNFFSVHIYKWHIQEVVQEVAR